MRELIRTATTAIAAVMVMAMSAGVAQASDGVQLLVNPTPEGTSQGYGRSQSRVQIAGDTAVVSFAYTSLYPAYDHGGIVHVFERSSGAWRLSQIIRPPTLISNDNFGFDIALDGNVLVVRASRNVVNDESGGLYFYARVDGQWVLEHIEPGFAAPTIGGLALAGDHVFASVTESKPERGEVAVFRRLGGTWEFTGYLDRGPLPSNPHFGRSLAADGQWCVVGNVNAAHVYQFDGMTWCLTQTILPNIADMNVGFGHSLDIHDDLIAVNDPAVEIDIGGVEPGLGATYVYRLDPTTMIWLDEARLDPVVDPEFYCYDVAVGDGYVVVSGGKIPELKHILYSRLDIGWTPALLVGGECPYYYYNCLDAFLNFGGSFDIDGDRLLAASNDFRDDREYAAATTALSVGLGPDCNGNGVNDAAEIILGAIDCNGNGVPDECESAGVGDCNDNGICDAFEIQIGAFDDCNGNGVIDDVCELIDVDSDGDGVFDECDNCVDLFNPEQSDCDSDGIGDLCAIASGLVEDCNKDGIPDFCQGDYVLDTGLPVRFWVGNNSDYDCVSIQAFTVQPGGEIVNGIAILWAQGYFEPMAPRPATLLLYSDPNNDGDPNDGRLLWQKDVISTRSGDGFGTYPVEDIFVGNAGQTFFVAVKATGHYWPAPESDYEDNPPGRWIAADAIAMFDPNDLASMAILPPEFREGGPWMIRASVAPRVLCECTADIASSDDAASQGDGAVDVHDLIALLAQWGACAQPCPPTCPADITGDCVVDIFDLLALLTQWGPCA